MNTPCVFCSSPVAPVVPTIGYSCNEINPLLKEKFNPLFYFTCSYPDCFVVVSRSGGGDFALQHNNDSTKQQEHMLFVLNESFQITLNPDEDKTLILHEHKHGVRFVLTKRSYHSWMSLNRIDKSNKNIDIEASILFPPVWKINDELREVLKDVASSDEKIIEFMTNLANDGDKEMSDLLARLHPRWVPVKFELLTMDKDSDNEVEAYLLQLPFLSNIDGSLPFNIDITIKEI